MWNCGVDVYHVSVHCIISQVRFELSGLKLCVHESAARHFLSKNHRKCFWSQLEARGTPVDLPFIPVVSLAYIQQRHRQKMYLTRGHQQRVEQNIGCESQHYRQNLIWPLKNLLFCYCPPQMLQSHLKWVWSTDFKHLCFCVDVSFSVCECVSFHAVQMKISSEN